MIIEHRQTAAVISHGPPKTGYERYPLTMTHPHFKPATMWEVPNGRITDYAGTPAMFPPVTAMNEDQEERLAADGYLPAGQVDPAAWVQAHSDAPADTYNPQKYPLWRNGVLILTAQEDPEADQADLAPRHAADAVHVQPHRPADPQANVLAQMEAMQETMRQMSETMQALGAENARLKAEAEARPRPGRPRKAA